MYEGMYKRVDWGQNIAQGYKIKASIHVVSLLYKCAMLVEIFQLRSYV